MRNLIFYTLLSTFFYLSACVNKQATENIPVSPVVEEPTETVIAPSIPDVAFDETNKLTASPVNILSFVTEPRPKMNYLNLIMTFKNISKLAITKSFFIIGYKSTQLNKPGDSIPKTDSIGFPSKLLMAPGQSVTYNHGSNIKDVTAITSITITAVEFEDGSEWVNPKIKKLMEAGRRKNH